MFYRALITVVTICCTLDAGRGYAACNILNGKGYGDCANVRINEDIRGWITVRSHRVESGIIEGAHVENGGKLRLYGISEGDVIVHPGASVYVSGIVNGTLTTLGGYTEIEGVVAHLHAAGGKVVIAGTVGSVSGDSGVVYKDGAVINGLPVKARIGKGSEKK